MMGRNGKSAIELIDLGFSEGLLYGALFSLLGSEGRPKKVFDWHKAAALIKEHGIKNAFAGLAEDWRFTSGAILKDGEIVPEEETYVYLSSAWATPVLVDDDTHEIYPCYIADTEEENPQYWTSMTYWPESAVAMLKGEDSNGG